VVGPVSVGEVAFVFSDDEGDGEGDEEVSPSVEAGEAVSVDRSPSHPQIVSFGTQTTVWVVLAIVEVSNLVEGVTIAVERIGLIVQETRLEGRPEGI
jgi:hypothetical protein